MHTGPANDDTTAMTAQPARRPTGSEGSIRVVCAHKINHSSSFATSSSSSSVLQQPTSTLINASSDTAKSTNKAESFLLKRKEQDKKKREEQRKQGMSFEEEDIKVDDEGKVTAIEDVPISKLSLETLKAFARKLRLKINSSITKGDLLKELANYKRLAPQRTIIKQAVVSSSGAGTGNSLPPGLLHVEGTIFRVILTILDPLNRETYMGTAQQINRGELGSKEKHVPNFAILANAYNDDSNDDYNDAGVSLSPHQDIYDVYGVNDETPSKFDVLDATKFAQVLNFVHKKYR